MKDIKGILIIGIGLLTACQSATDKQHENLLTQKFANILNVHGIPVDPKDRSVYSFSDLGAWHSYTLSPHPSGGFVGPFLMTDDNGLWASDQLVTLKLSANEQPLDWSTGQMMSSEYRPGRLIQVYQLGTFTITQQLIFISDRSTLIEYEIKSNKKEALVKTHFEVNSWLDQWNLKVAENELLLNAESSGTQLTIKFQSEIEGQKTNRVFSGQEKEFSLNANFPIKMSYVQSAYFSDKEREADAPNVEKALANSNLAFAKNDERWQDYIKQTLSKTDGTPIDTTFNRLAVKSLNTLINNWRSAAGELKHDGLFPSYAYGGFHGFWAWDSWKHAVGLADIAPELAKDQILTMYDYQDVQGMIADCIFRDTLIEKHNWRDTKPPLSGWAIVKVFEATQDTNFVKTLYPKLKKYHQWWYDYRDHDGNGLCEYGATDGTRVAAAWESGMDNAVRFDEATMKTNAGGGFSLDQESVDLNAYLYAEKLYIASLAKILGKPLEANQLKEEALRLKTQIKNAFYDKEKGFFFDRRLNGQMIEIYGPEGWIPLWASIASEEQAAAVVVHLLDKSRFNTKVPFPTLDASHEKFNPKNGYWRGPVWLDQVYFAIQGLEKYGYKQEVQQLKKKLIMNAEGLLSDEPIRENYHPTTGEGLNAKHFSWSAAHLLMLIRE